MSHFLSHCNQCDKNYPADLPKCPKCGNWVDISPAPLDPRDWGYDIETYPNAFTATWIHAATGLTIVHEISDRRNDWSACVEFMYNLGRSGARGVGFNNLYFDYPVLHWLAGNTGCDARAIYDKAMSIIKGDDRWGSQVWDSDQIFPQLDLFKICHFDNKARSTSLKALEIVMRSRNVIDLPFPVGTVLTSEQIDVLLRYNLHDVRETLKFYVRCLDQIQFREQLTERYSRNFMNHNDTKIGKDYFIMELEKAGVQCFDRGPQGRVPRQTVRGRIALGDVVFPYVKFERPEFQRVLDFFRSTTITETKGVFEGLNAVVDGFQFDFGTGGIHGSIPSQVVCSDDEYVVIDVDVASYYPNLAIANRLYPEHLSEQFCDIYKSVYDQRASYAKGTAENAMLKLALNGVYGDSNNVYSPFYDPAYTMAITINGQLLLCMLAERLIELDGVTMVQANTDGLTVRAPRVQHGAVRDVCKWWEQLTGLQLEEAIYSRMFIKDVNNYIAEYATSGKLKRKGAYEYNTQWHQDPSSPVVAMAAEAALVRGIPVREFITNHREPFDFMLRAKVPRGNKLMHRWPEFGVELELQHITRYFISRNGGYLVKVAPPTGEPGTWKRKPRVSEAIYQSVMREIDYPDFAAPPASELDAAGTPWDARIHTGNKSKHDTREMSINSGWRVTECADAALFDWGSLNYEWYIGQASKLVDPLVKVG